MPDIERLQLTAGRAGLGGIALITADTRSEHPVQGHSQKQPNATMTVYGVRHRAGFVAMSRLSQGRAGSANAHLVGQPQWLARRESHPGRDSALPATGGRPRSGSRNRRMGRRETRLVGTMDAATSPTPREGGGDPVSPARRRADGWKFLKKFA